MGVYVGTLREIWRYPVKSMGGERLESCRVMSGLGVSGDRGWAAWDSERSEIRSAKKLPALMQCSARYLEEPIDGSTPPVEVRLPDGRTLSVGNAALPAELSKAMDSALRLVARQPAEDLDHYRRAEPIVDLEREIRLDCGLLADEPLPPLDEVPPELLELAAPPGTYFDAFEIHALTTASLAELTRLAPDSCIDPRRFRPNFLIESPEGLTGLPELAWTGRELRIGEVRLAGIQPMMRCAMATWAQAELPKDTNIMRVLVRELEQNLGGALSVLEPGAVRVGDTVELID